MVVLASLITGAVGCPDMISQPFVSHCLCLCVCVPLSPAWDVAFSGCTSYCMLLYATENYFGHF